MTNEVIYNMGVRYLGVREVPGKGSHPVIAEMFKLAPSWLNQDDSATAWCGLFRGYVGHLTGTGLPAQHYRAASWLKWGRPVPLKEAVQGDTVIMKRLGGHHVALLDCVQGNWIYLLGGNQGDAVTVSKFPIAHVVGVRRLVAEREVEAETVEGAGELKAAA